MYCMRSLTTYTSAYYESWHFSLLLVGSMVPQQGSTTIKLIQPVNAQHVLNRAKVMA